MDRNSAADSPVAPWEIRVEDHNSVVQLVEVRNQTEPVVRTAVRGQVAVAAPPVGAGVESRETPDA